MRVTGIYTGPSSYTSGGEVLTAAIAHAAFAGLNTIDRLDFTPMYDVTNSKSAMAVFDHNRSGSTQGKIHITSGGESAHAHDILLVGGQGAGVATQIDVDTAAAVFGKQAATNRTLAAGQGTKNIQQNVAAISSSDAAAAGNYSTFACRFVAEGC